MNSVRIDDERERFVIARWAYSVGSPIMSDADYSVLLNYMQSRYPDDEYVNRSWSSDPCPIDLLVKHGLQRLAESVVITDKTESIPSINTWVDLYAELGSFRGQGSLSMKHDGWNIQASYYEGHLVKIQTRGRVYNSLDMSLLRDKVPAMIPWGGRVNIVHEATVSKKNFGFCKSTFGNVDERSAVHTLLSRPEYVHMIDLHALDIHGVKLNGNCKFLALKEAGFQIPTYLPVTDYSEIESAIHILSKVHETYESPTDGMVFEGSCTRAIRLAAWEEPILQSYVTGYAESYRIHYISPELEIRPITRKGGVQRKIAITNWQRIIDNNLRIGYPVAFRIASGVTADFDEDATRLLQKEYEGHYREYREKVDREERLRKCQ